MAVATWTQNLQKFIFSPPGRGKSYFMNYAFETDGFANTDFNPERDLLPALEKIRKQEEAEMEAAWERIVKTAKSQRWAYKLKFYSKETFINHVKQRRQEKKCPYPMPQRD